MLICGLGVLVLIALCCPDTAIGRAVRRVLVDRPAAALNNLTPRRALLLALACLFAVAFAQIAPAEFLWIMASDAATWLEIAAAAWLLSASRLTHRLLGEVASKMAGRLRLSIRAVGRIRARRVARAARPPRRPAATEEERTSPWAVFA